MLKCDRDSSAPRTKRRRRRRRDGSATTSKEQAYFSPHFNLWMTCRQDGLFTWHTCCALLPGLRILLQESGTRCGGKSMYCDFAFSALIECLRAFHLRYKLHGLSATHQKTFPLTLSLSEKSSYQSPIPKVQNLPLKPSFFLQPQKSLLPQHTHLSAPYYSIIPEIKNFYATMSVSTFIPAN